VILESTVLAAERPRVLEHSWGPRDRLRWVLEATDFGTQLTLHHTFAEADLAPKMAAGWHLCLDVAYQYLAGTPVTPIRGMDAMNHGWEELRQEYEKLLK
jgi:hypothetical protein